MDIMIYKVVGMFIIIQRKRQLLKQKAKNL